jgi:hypothetical protein
MEQRWSYTERVNRSTLGVVVGWGGGSSPSTTSATTHLTWNSLGYNPGLDGERWSVI